MSDSEGSESCPPEERFGCLACTDSLSLFPTYEQVRVHTLELHTVSLDSAAQAVIRLPRTLFRYRWGVGCEVWGVRLGCEMTQYCSGVRSALMTRSWCWVRRESPVIWVATALSSDGVCPVTARPSAESARLCWRTVRPGLWSSTTRNFTQQRALPQLRSSLRLAVRGDNQACDLVREDNFTLVRED